MRIMPSSARRACLYLIGAATVGKQRRGDYALIGEGMPKSRKLDIHTHILPRALPNLAEKYGYGDWIRMCACPCDSSKMDMYKGADFFRTVDANCFDPVTRIAECDAAGVSVQVLSPVPVYFSYWAKPEDTAEVCRLINDEIADIVRRFPKRFIGLGILPLQDPKLAVAELERCMEIGLVGVEIGTHVNKWNLNAPELFEVFESASKLKAAVFIHPWDMMGMDTMETKYWLPWLVSMPAETSRAICSMIFGGVFERLPELKVCFAHGGGSFPATIGRVEHGFNCRPDLCAVDNSVNPREYMGRFWVDSLVHDPKMLTYLVELVGEDKVILGTDYPFPLGEQEPGKLIEESTFEKIVQEKLLWDNAMEFFNLDSSQFD